MNLRPRILYFFHFAVLACNGRFTSLYLENYGLSKSQVGIAFSIGMVFSLISAPGGGYFADKWQDGRRKVLILSHLIAAPLFVSLKFLSGSSIPVAMAIFTLYKAARASAIPVLDGWTMDILDREPMINGEDSQAARKSRYGEERLWGAIGWGAMSIVLGKVLDTTGFDVMYVFLILTTSIMLFLLFFGQDPTMVKQMIKSKHSDTIEMHNLEVEGTTPTREDSVKNLPVDNEDMMDRVQQFLKLFVAKRKNLVFAYTVLVMGAGMAVVENLVFLFFVEDLKASYFLCGFTVIVTIIFEVIIFAYSTVVEKFSRKWLMVIGMLCYIVRVIFYTLIDSDHQWYILFLEPLHGATYSLIQLATVQEISELAPDSLQATAQGLMTFCRTSGYLVGIVGGSFILEEFGNVLLYQCCALFVTSALVLYIFTHWGCMSKSVQDYEQVEIDES